MRRVGGLEWVIIIFNSFILYSIDKEHIHCVRQTGAGGWSWNSVREKYCYLAGGWRIVLERYEGEIL